MSGLPNSFHYPTFGARTYVTAAVVRNKHETARDDFDFYYYVSEYDGSLLRNQGSLKSGLMPPNDPAVFVSSVGNYSLAGIFNDRSIVNQDRTVLQQGDLFLDASEPWSLFAVFDGHGHYGHKVADSAAASFVPQLRHSVQRSSLHIDMVAHLRSLYSSIDEHILSSTTSSAKESGSTATVAIIAHGNLIVAGTGDSSAVLGVRTNAGVTAVELTRSHVPTDANEKARILRHGGELRQQEFGREGGLKVAAPLRMLTYADVC